jgi:hypothetical protein
MSARSSNTSHPAIAATRDVHYQKNAPSSSLSIDEEWGLFLGRMLLYILGSTIKLCGVVILCGEPGACVTFVAVTLNTYSLPALPLIAYR